MHIHLAHSRDLWHNRPEGGGRWGWCVLTAGRQWKVRGERCWEVRRCDDGVKSVSANSSCREDENAGCERHAISWVFHRGVIEIVAQRRSSTFLPTRGTRGTRKALWLHRGVATISHPRGNALAEEETPHPSVYDGVYATAQVCAKCLSVSRSSYCVIKW